MPYASGGALDDANFAIQVVVAIGTLGAATAAVWLGLRAEGEKKRQRRDAAHWNARQVISVIRPWVRSGDGPPSGGGPALEIVNGSTEAITNVRAEIAAEPRGADPAAELRDNIGWEWSRDVTPRADYLLPSQSEYLRGHGMRNGVRVHRLKWIEDEVTFHTLIAWLDGHGTHWTRYYNGEPFISSAAAPHRDLQTFLARPKRWQLAWRRTHARARAEHCCTATGSYAPSAGGFHPRRRASTPTERSADLQPPAAPGQLESLVARVNLDRGQAVDDAVVDDVLRVQGLEARPVAPNGV